MSEGLDLSRIVGLIMQNPELISKISELASSPKSDTVEELPPTAEADEEKDEPTAAAISRNDTIKHDRRTSLISAMKPYLSDDRARTLDTMMTVLEMVETVRRK